MATQPTRPLVDVTLSSTLRSSWTIANSFPLRLLARSQSMISFLPLVVNPKFNTLTSWLILKSRKSSKEMTKSQMLRKMKMQMI